MKASREEENKEQPLLTEKSFALALAPPRAPPLGTAQRHLLVSADEDLSKKPFVSSERISVRTRARLQQHLFSQHAFYSKHRLPHPHLPLVAAPGDQMTRFLGTVLPIPLQNRTRDSGTFRWIVDSLVQVSAPLMALTAPTSALRDFVRLSQTCVRHAYASHPLQFIELYLPKDEKKKKKTRHLVFFVHGGAWGSGMPWMYRLVAAPFVCKDTAVAVIGYRTYPSSQTVKEQVEDCQLAADFLLQEYPELCQGIITVMGHSSGAHIALLMIVEQAKEWLRRRKLTLHVTNFVGLSGPYDISHHFDYEAARGVEELSPMKPVCGYTREAFRSNTPHLRLQDCLMEIKKESWMSQCMPPNIALVHGMEDDTVPFTATGEAARVLRACGVKSCDELYIARTGHQDVIVQMMLGGPAQDAVMNWMRAKGETVKRGIIQNEKKTSASSLFVTSKL